jgi:hypothetical protein
MAWNTWMTMRGTQNVDAPIPAPAPQHQSAGSAPAHA